MCDDIPEAFVPEVHRTSVPIDVTETLARPAIPYQGRAFDAAAFFMFDSHARQNQVVRLPLGK